MTAAEERIAALEAELADLKQRFGNMAVRVAAPVVHHEMPDAAALPGHGRRANPPGSPAPRAGITRGEAVMRDPHVHVEKTPMPGFGHAAIQSIITEATGLVPDLPKTVGTGCGRRRPIAMTSTVPEKVTCLACLEYAHEEYLMWAGTARAAAEIAEAEPRAAIAAKTTPADLRAEERTYRALAARFEVTR